MKLSEQDWELFKKLGCKNLIDLALFLPKKIENLNFSPKPCKELCVEEVEILNATYHYNKILGTCKCLKWDILANFVFFNPTQWHIKIFKPHQKFIFHAKMNFFGNSWQFINPKILKKAGIYVPKFGISGIKDENISRLIANSLTKENLSTYPLNEKHINLLLNLHKNDEQCFVLHQNLKLVEKDLKYIEISNFIRRLDNKKHIYPSYELELFDIQEWLENLPFKPTQDQRNAILDIAQDLRSKFAKRRVIMGDVGCGKTLVLLAAALMVYPKQAILMVPTSILAQQLYDEAKKLLPHFMNVLFIKGGKKEKNLNEKIQEAHLIIGTHALLHLQSHNAVLVMIDEQHRFGSNQRQAINDLSKNNGLTPHFIQFSATPIPRTLSMIQSHLLNFSFIKEMPFKKDITTLCIQNEDLVNLNKEIQAQIAQKHQVLIIYPLVTPSDKIPYLSLEQARKYWEERYEKVFVTHGKDKEKEKILLQFRNEGNILLSTTVIEVGISLPRLSMIIIVGAERLGLATLHQLRGRVGRVGLKSTCYLYTKLKEIPQRLKDFAKTLDGFKIAELDLKNRLSGDLLDGVIQHGNHFKFFDFSQDGDILEQINSKN